MNFLVLALAVYGISALMSEYDGPKGMFKTLRDEYPESPLTCAVCLSVWLSIPILIIGTQLGMIFITPFAIVGVVILLEKL